MAYLVIFCLQVKFKNHFIFTLLAFLQFVGKNAGDDIIVTKNSS